MSLSETYLRDIVARLDGPAPSMEVQESYARQHPHERRPRAGHHGNAKHIIEIDGERKSANAWSVARGFKPQTVNNRIQCGWHPVVAVLGERGESKVDAHWRLKLKATHSHTNKHKDAALAKQRRTPPVVMAVAPAARALPIAQVQSEPHPWCAIYMKGARIEFDGSYSLSPDKADELALNLIRMASDIRGRLAK